MKRDPLSNLNSILRRSPPRDRAGSTGECENAGERDVSPDWPRRLLFLLGFLALFGLVYIVRDTLIPLFLSMLIAYLLMPLADYMEHRGLGRITATAVTFLLFFSLLFLIGLYLVPLVNEELSGLRSGLPGFIWSVNEEIAGIQSRLAQHWPAIEEVDVRLRIQKFVLDTLNSIPSYVINVFSIFPLLILVPLISFFFLKDALRIKKGFLSMVPNRYFEMVFGLLHEIDRKLGGYIRGQLLRSTIIGFLTFLGLTLFGLKYALILAIFAGVMNLVPYAGPLIGAVPALILAFLGQAAPHTLGSTLSPLPLFFNIGLVYIVVQSLDAVWIAPYILGWSVDIHPLGIVLLLLFGNQLFGWWGIILAVPVASIVGVVFQAIYRRYQIYRF